MGKAERRGEWHENSDTRSLILTFLQSIHFPLGVLLKLSADGSSVFIVANEVKINEAFT